MKWYLLVDRRHLGPFSAEEIHQKIKSGSAHGEDYLIGVEDSEEGSLKYRKILEVFPQWVPKPKPPSSKSSDSESKSKENENADRFLGSFSEDEILNNEVSRVFAQELDSTILLKKSSEQTGITQIRGGKGRPPPPGAGAQGNLPFSPMRGQIRKVGTPSIGGPNSSEEGIDSTPSKSGWYMAIPGVFLFLSLISFPFWPGGNPLTKMTQKNSDVKQPNGSANPVPSAQSIPKAPGTPPSELSIRVPEVSSPAAPTMPDSVPVTDEPSRDVASEPSGSGRRSAKRLRAMPKPEPVGMRAFEKPANERDDEEPKADDPRSERIEEDRESNVDDTRENRESEKPPAAEVDHNSEDGGPHESPPGEEEPKSKKDPNRPADQED